MSKDDTPRGRIIRAAARSFAVHGYEGTTMRDLADAVGIQSGSLFHHFASKQEILETVMVEVVELNTARMRDALAAAPTALERLRALICCELLSIHGETGQAMTLLVVEWRSLEGDAQARVLALRDRYDRMWLDAIRGAKRDLVAMEPFILRRLLGGAIANTAYWYRAGGRLSLDELTDRVLTLATR